MSYFGIFRERLSIYFQRKPIQKLVIGNSKDKAKKEYRLSMRITKEIDDSLSREEERTQKRRSVIVTEAILFYLSLKDEIMGDMQEKLFDWLDTPEGIKFIEEYWEKNLDRMLEKKLEEKLRRAFEPKQEYSDKS